NGRTKRRLSRKYPVALDQVAPGELRANNTKASPHVRSDVGRLDRADRLQIDGERPAGEHPRGGADEGRARATRDALAHHRRNSRRASAIVRAVHGFGLNT